MKFVIVKVFVLCHLRHNQRVDWIELSISVSIIKVGIRVGDSHSVFPLLHCWLAPVQRNKAFQRWYGAGNLPVASSCTSRHLPSVHENNHPACSSVNSDCVVDVGFLFFFFRYSFHFVWGFTRDGFEKQNFWNNQNFYLLLFAVESLLKSLIFSSSEYYFLLSNLKKASVKKV